MVKRNTLCIKEIKKRDKATKKYVIEFDGKIYETDYEKNIIYIMHNQYIDNNDSHIKMLERIDFARELMIYSIMEELNVEICIGNKTIKGNINSDKGYMEYENVDVIIDVENEISMFSAINKIGYAKIYKKKHNDKYILF